MEKQQKQSLIATIGGNKLIQSGCCLVRSGGFSSRMHTHEPADQATWKQSTEYCTTYATYSCFLTF